MLDESALRGAKLCVVGNVDRDHKAAPFFAGRVVDSDDETSIVATLETIGRTKPHGITASTNAS